MTNTSVAFTRPEVRNEDIDKDEGLCLCNVEGTRDIGVMAGIGAREGRELVSPPEGELVHDVVLGSVFVRVVVDEYVKL